MRVRNLLKLATYLWLCTLTSYSIAASLAKDGVQEVFSGSYGASQKIEMTLTRSGDNLSGSYISGPENKLAQLRGKIDSDGVIELAEMQNGGVNGRFRGQISGNSFKGQWESVGSETSFSFSMTSSEHQDTSRFTAAHSDIVEKQNAAPGIKQAETSSRHNEAILTGNAVGSVQPSPVPETDGIAPHPQVDLTSKRFLEYTLIAWSCIVLIGIFLGVKDVIVVFRNYNDLAIVFASGGAIAATFLTALSDQNGTSVLPQFFGALAIGSILWIIVRTIIDNKNPLWAVIALVSKMTLSVLFLINLIGFVAPSGKTARARASSRSSSFVMLLLIAPITFALVKEKTGMFSPRSVLGNKF